MPFQPEHAETTFRALMEFAPDAMIIVDAEGRIVLLNRQAERLFGYAREELTGQPVEALVPARFAHHIAHRSAYVADPSARPMGTGLELFARRKDGSEIPVEISLSPISTDPSMLIAAAIRDVSERIAMERMLEVANRRLEQTNARLEEAGRAKDGFLASMSHELRTPLNAIIGFTGTLLMRLPGPLTNEQEEQLRLVRSSGLHLLSLINDLLDVSRIESGKVELHYEPVDVGALCTSIASSLDGMATDKNLLLEVTGLRTRIVAVTDERALRQILINLVTNGIKYTEDGFVRVHIDAPDTAMAEISVIDSGPGIREEDRLRIFREFEQIQYSKDKGAGLGLYISTKLAALLGGTLECTSLVGSGSTFTLRIPLSNCEDPEKAVFSEASPSFPSCSLS